MSASLRVLVAPDSFGGALDSVAVAGAIATGWQRARPEDTVSQAPMADGGEGTLAAVAAALGDRAFRRSVAVHDALGRPISADYLLLEEGSVAFVEMAAASGLAQLKVEERTPASARIASTGGTGELVRSALDAGVKRVILGLGGSATNDGGSGMLAALGVRFLDMAGGDLGPGGAALAELIVIDPTGLDPRLAQVEVVVASDVTNPLTGPAGAAATYGPQKGADADAVADLDAALGIYGTAIQAATNRDVADHPGAGAAGGTGAALLGFTNATLRPGVEVVAEMIGLTAALEDADLVITGEGRADEQTLAGKAAMGVAQMAGGRGTPVVLLCGTLGPGSEALEVSGLFQLIQPVADRPMTLAEAMADTERLLTNAAERLAASIGIGLALAER
ncbi:MAG TPA: glycerate kinase [Candidatus Limnocylindria bacterium]|jgi:glycerate kinase|nr:glycerate kinase [Candidatus Limnocylindria bacterium]